MPADDRYEMALEDEQAVLDRRSPPRTQPPPPGAPKPGQAPAAAAKRPAAGQAAAAAGPAAAARKPFNFEDEFADIDKIEIDQSVLGAVKQQAGKGAAPAGPAAAAGNGAMPAQQQAPPPPPHPARAMGPTVSEHEPGSEPASARAGRSRQGSLSPSGRSGRSASSPGSVSEDDSQPRSRKKQRHKKHKKGKSKKSRRKEGGRRREGSEGPGEGGAGEEEYGEELARRPAEQGLPRQERRWGQGLLRLLVLGVLVLLGTAACTVVWLVTAARCHREQAWAALACCPARPGSDGRATSGKPTLQLLLASSST